MSAPVDARAGRHGPAEPGTARPGSLTPLRGQVSLRGGVLGERQQANAERGLAHGWRMLEAAGPVGNFVLAARGGSAGYRGGSYLDSDVYKWLEAVCWEGQRGLPEPLALASARAIELLAMAQLPDGYLNTYVQVHAPGQRWAPTNRHEFYNLSHLLQAGVAAVRSGVNDRLAELAVRAADQLERTCTGRANAWKLGHPGIEMALVELYRVAGDSRYLDLAGRLVEFRDERSDVLVGSGLSEWEDVLLPKPSDPGLSGHAVCATYLAAGLTDLLAEGDDPGLAAVIDAKWQDMVLRKSYLTGNVGSRHAGEAIGRAYELPNDRAYCETCAGIGVLMWSWRMLLLYGEPRYADWFEKVLYNAVLCGVSPRGDRFFYANPLEDEGEMERLPWYACSCCPTNVMRLLAQLEHYVATQSPAGIQIHQYASAQISTGLDAAGAVRLSVRTRFPLDGKIEVQVDQPGRGEWTLSVRVPSWCAGEPAVRVNGEQSISARRQYAGSEDHRAGYLDVRRLWSAGDVLSVEFPISAGYVEADWRSRGQRGSVAVVRGPLVYCAEGHDQPAGTDLSSVRVLPAASLQSSLRQGPLGEHVALHARGRRVSQPPEQALYRPWKPPEPVTGQAAQIGSPEELTLIPYFLWANRGRSPMRVWLDTAR